MMYLDHVASTTIRPEAIAALDDAYERLDRNASGLHEESRRAKNALEESRERAAALVGPGFADPFSALADALVAACRRCLDRERAVAVLDADYLERASCGDESASVE